MTSVDARLAELASAVAAPGSDPGRLVAVVAWLAAPRRGPTALRRAVVAAHERGEADPDGAGLDAVLPAAGPTDRELRAAHDVLERWASLRCRVVLVDDPAYPTRLRADWPDRDAPPLLVLRGDLASDRPAVALVGARRASGYGTGVASWLAEGAAAAGVRVVSGGAVGIDAAAHRAAVEQPGGTTVVLGCGHGIGYPRGHAQPGGLFDRVVASGGAVISEQFPDQRPRAGVVRARNRLVAALTDVTVVVEGGERSGALLTAGAAAERSREVLAVPGDVRAPGSSAPHRLLAEGVFPCLGPQQLLEQVRTAVHGVVGWSVAASTSASTSPSGALDDGAPTLPGISPALSTLPDDVHAHLSTVWPRPLRPDDLATATGRPAPQVLAAITRAQVSGELTVDTDGVRLRRAPAGRQDRG